jgi:hypothetical protein
MKIFEHENYFLFEILISISIMIINDGSKLWRMV